MGQIFDRFSRIVKTNVKKDDSVNDYFFNSYSDEDSELKKAIDELNSSKSNDNSTKDSNRANFDNFKVELAYKLLNLSNNSSIDEIKLAYKSRIKEYHPDKVAGLGKEIQAIAQSKTQELNQAYTLLKNVRNF